jgi:hypothetical protein
MKRKERKFETPRTIPPMVWDKDQYSRVPRGRYSAVATRIQGPEWVRAFRRWSIIVEFELLSESAPVCAFYNLGNDPDRLHFGRKSKYVHDWTIANGEAPHKGQTLNPTVFMTGQVFELEISDSLRNSEEQQKSEPEIYSRVSAMIQLLAPSLHSPNQESVNHKSGITQSNNQVINQSRWPTLQMRAALREQ